MTVPERLPGVGKDVGCLPKQVERKKREGYLAGSGRKGIHKTWDLEVKKISMLT
jgi:hypothetical protein